MRMRTDWRTVRSAGAVACLLAACVNVSAAAAKILLLAGPDSHGWGCHEHHAGIELLAAALDGAGLGIEPVVHRGQWPDASDAFAEVKSIVIYCDGGGQNILKGHEEDMRRLMDRGVGLVCLHYALEADKDVLGPVLAEWVGGYFEVNWSVNPIWTPEGVRLAEHPVTRGVTPVEIEDEWYYHMRFRPGMRGVTPLLSALPPLDTLSAEDGLRSGNSAVREELQKGQLQHLAWATENANGSRAFGFTGGHFHRNWADDGFRMLALNAIVWTAGLDVPADGTRSATPVILRHPTLLKAVSKGDAQDVERHIALGAPAKDANKMGWTPLHYAVVRRHKAVADVLIRHGADLNAVTAKKKSCLHFCAQRNYLDLATLLIENGANLAQGDADGWTALHMAAARDNVEMARLLLANGADVNARAARGGTPLHEAAASAGRDVLSLLLERGADRAITADNGKTALNYARELGNQAAIDVLSK